MAESSLRQPDVLKLERTALQQHYLKKKRLTAAGKICSLVSGTLTKNRTLAQTFVDGTECILFSKLSKVTLVAYVVKR